MSSNSGRADSICSTCIMQNSWLFDPTPLDLVYVLRDAKNSLYAIKQITTWYSTYSRENLLRDQSQQSILFLKPWQLVKHFNCLHQLMTLPHLCQHLGRIATPWMSKILSPFKKITLVTHRNTLVLTGKAPLWQPQKPNLLPENRDNQGKSGYCFKRCTYCKIYFFNSKVE